MQRHERLEQDVKIALSDIIMNEVKEPSVTGLISMLKLLQIKNMLKCMLASMEKEIKIKLLML